MLPPFPEIVIAEDADNITKQDPMGLIYREFKKNSDTSMPEYIGSPVKNPEDWDAVKQRLIPDVQTRYPAEWNELVARWKKEKPILNQYSAIPTGYYGGPSLYGFVRMLVGEEKVLYLFYDNPALVNDMMETSTEFFIRILEKSLREAPLSLVQFWEDMCYRNGPLISPAMVKEFMVPRYKRITATIRDAGHDIIMLDSDGDVKELIPLWLESGINGVFPMEQAAGNDILLYRKEYGQSLLMTGGIDKRVLTQDERSIDKELEKKIALAFEGGYVPMLDHGVPPDISFRNFMYYWSRKKKLLGV
jgi:uroporphyrinogen decarboxylase